jgi:sterol desaturase/sphingolipid hydroxylase (fatty acid hydroxylase superfamily)
VDEAFYGKRNRRGDWQPDRLVTYPPVFVWPVKPIAFLKWVFGYPGYLAPWNLLYGCLAALIWLYALPPMHVMKTLSIGWIAFLFVENAVLVVVVFGLMHLRLYMQRKQGITFKYNAKWPSAGNGAFLFANQTVDNVVWTFGSAIPIWTAYEVFMMWMFENGHIPYVRFSAHPIYCIALLLLTPLARDLHFYLVHRAMHLPALYPIVHKLHHNNVNPGPWSGLAMSPFEHLLYFSGCLIHCVIPSNPIHVVFHLAHMALIPAATHSGFDKIVIGDEAIETHCFDHYLHHKYFECNYSDGIIPFDRWFGTFHDGSKEAQELMDARFLATAKRRQLRNSRRKKVNSTAA